MPDSAVPSLHGLSIEAVEWLPSGAESDLVRVRGRWTEPGAEPRELPALIVRAGARDHRFDSLADARFARDPQSWRGSYLVPSALVAADPDALWVEWPGGARAVLPAMARGLVGDAPEKPSPPGVVVDRAVLADRRARRAEASEEAQARVAAEALQTVQALERRLEAVSAPPDGLGAALASAAEMRIRAGEWHRELRAAEVARTSDATRLRLLEAAHVASTAEREALHRRIAGLEAESLARAALEDELDRERAAGEPLAADLAAALRARETAEAALAALRGELAVAAAARETASAALSTAEMALAELSAELDAERHARLAAESALAAALTHAEQAGETLQDRVAELERHAEPEADRLDRLAREQAEAAASREAPERTDLAARLDAAAAALRERTPAPDEASSPGLDEDEDVSSPAAADEDEEVSSPVAADAVSSPPDRRLRGAVVKLAHDDPAAAGRLLAGLLPAQGAVLTEPLAYDLTIREVGTFAVDVADGSAAVAALDKPRPRREAAFHLSADALTLAELLAGTDHHIGRFRGPARIRGRRRRHKPLRALAAADLGLTQATRAGARLDPGLAWLALSHAVEPGWTSGLVFTVAGTVDEETWYLTARDSGGLAASSTQPDGGAKASVTMSRAAFDRLLRDEPHPKGDRPSIRGDHDAVAALLALIVRART